MNREEYCKNIATGLQEEAPSAYVTWGLDEFTHMYEIKIMWHNWNCVLTEKSYDKFYLPFNNYENHDAIKYEERDVILSIHNLKYAILEMLRKDIFNKN